MRFSLGFSGSAKIERTFQWLHDDLFGTKSTALQNITNLNHRKIRGQWLLSSKESRVSDETEVSATSRD